jgi:cytochrome oxidase Cu insertion factor (SCO1/SenC/PrrC family)
MKKQILFLIVASYTPYVLFGHLKGFFGWEVAFLFYSLCYFGLGLFLRKTTIRPAVYHTIAFSSLTMYAIFLYSENASFYFPMITPATLIVGSLSYILGCIYGFQQSKKYLILMSLLLVAEFVYGSYFVSNYMYHRNVNLPENKYLLNQLVNVVQLRNLKGELIPNKQFDNKVLVLDFWYTKCGNCLLKLRELDKLYEYFSDNPNVLVASIVDGKLSSLEETNELLKDWKFKHPVFYDSLGLFTNKYRIAENGYSIELIIDRKSYIKQTYVGLAESETTNYLNLSIANIENLLKN